jgi:DNA-directed RNA polymerase specialized sigma24 family protein
VLPRRKYVRRHTSRNTLALQHEGVKRRSGRYPWGSGENPQRNKSFRQMVKDLEDQGLTKKEIADGLGLPSVNRLKLKISLESQAQRKADTHAAQTLKDKGWSNTAIAERMGVNESTIRSWLDPARQEKLFVTENTAKMLVDQVEAKSFLDVGVGTNTHLGIASTKLDNAIGYLEEQGTHKLHYYRIEQQGTGEKTSLKILTKSDVDFKDVAQNIDKVRSINEWSEDGGRTYLGIKPPVSVNSKRILVKYDEDGGTDMDGVIQLRRGASDLSLGSNHYGQVRVLVDGTHYMKGMAIYKDDMPDGIDIIYNSNKSKVSNPNKLDVMKPIKDDPDNPFGATVRQEYYLDPKTGTKKLSALNIVGSATKEGSGVEGSWDSWSKTLSSQFLSKQTPALAKSQLKLSLDIQKAEFDEIMSITNPTIRRRLLDDFSDDCDSKAVLLKAAALPRQTSKVLIPITSLKEDEAYTTTYKNGTKLVLIRHPHGGTFELPVVTVNNNNKEGKGVLGQAIDAIGIHPKTAGILSGADFDGDAVIAIPYDKRIKTSDPLQGLKDFEPRHAYKETPGMTYMTKANTQTEMGKISNLITDMTLKGASSSELVRAVKHSMVVIDAEKHKLDYKQSYRDNDIGFLKERYQGGATRGAATLISRSKSVVYVNQRRPVTYQDTVDDPSLRGLVRRNKYSVDPKTGRKVWAETGEEYTNKKGKIVKRTTKSSKMYETEDAMKLSSGTSMEKVYGDYANGMKALGNQARQVSVNTPPSKYSRSAKKAHTEEVQSLQQKLTRAISNKPMERQAQILAGTIVKAKKQANPDMSKEDLRKIKAQALIEARRRTGAGKQKIIVTPDEWKAIQAGALTDSVLNQVISNAGTKEIKALALPRQSNGMSPAKQAQAKALLKRGYSQADVAEHLGVTSSQVNELVKGARG